MPRQVSAQRLQEAAWTLDGVPIGYRSGNSGERAGRGSDCRESLRRSETSKRPPPLQQGPRRCRVRYLSVCFAGSRRADGGARQEACGANAAGLPCRGTLGGRWRRYRVMGSWCGRNSAELSVHQSISHGPDDDLLLAAESQLVLYVVDGVADRRRAVAPGLGDGGVRHALRELCEYLFLPRCQRLPPWRIDILRQVAQPPEHASHHVPRQPRLSLNRSSRSGKSWGTR